MQLRADLAEAGARATIVDCDVTDEDDLAELLAKVPAEHPLTAVVHAAGVLDDRTISALTPRHLAEVMSPKIDAAWQLHKATAGLDLRAFVLFSSVAGVLGTPGQANYAAANAFLDALAQHRYAHGAAASSVAWGLWATATGMTGHLDVADVARLARTGTLPLATDEALGLVDAMLAGDHPALVAARLNLTGEAGVPPMLRHLVRVATRADAAAAPQTPISLVDELAALPEPDRHQRLLALVCSQVALVLGHTGAQVIDAGQPFKDLGFDSLATVELRNRIGLATGLRLPITLLFDDPTPSSLATRLRTLLLGGEAAAGGPGAG
jgi:acyl carrier protein